MKDLVINIGGHPLTADDLIWLQSEFKEVTQDLFGLFANLGSGNRLVCGGEVTTISPSNRSVNGGWVLWNNELIRFFGGSLTGTGHIVLSRATSNIPPSKVYQNGSTQWPFRETIATLGTTPSVGSISLLYLEQTLRAGVSTWTSVTLGSPDWQAYVTPTTYHPAAYRRIINGSTELRGHLEIGSTSAVATAFTLPATVSPKRTVSFARSYVNGSGAILPCWVEVQANGDVNILGIVADIGNHLSLDGISFDARA